MVSQDYCGCDGEDSLESKARLLLHFKITHIASKNRIYFNSSHFNSRSVLAFDPKNPNLFYILKPKLSFDIGVYQKRHGKTLILMSHPTTGFYFIKPQEKFNLETVRFIPEILLSDEDHYESENFANEELLYREETRTTNDFITRALPFDHFSTARTNPAIHIMRFDDSDEDSSDVVEFLERDGPNADNMDYDTTSSADTDGDIYSENSFTSSIDCLSDESDIESESNEEDSPLGNINEDFDEISLKRFIKLGRKLLKIMKETLQERYIAL